MNTQFPPSSPLLNNDSEHEDSFSALIQQHHNLKNVLNDTQVLNEKDTAYLTPDPSSSLGDVTVGSDVGDQSMTHSEVKSSPSKNNALLRAENLEHQDKKIKINEARSIDVTQPLNVGNFRNVINVPLNGDIFKIGRSGMSCSFKLNSNNKLISRIHAEIRYEKKSGMINLKCIGFNGINITIPRLINVKHLKNLEYAVSIDETAETDDEQDDNDRRILTKNNNFTNFFMLKGESIEIPLIDGIVLDFRGELALLVFNRDLKIGSSITNFESNSNTSRKLSTSELTAIVDQKKLQFSIRPTLSEIEKNSALFTKDASPITKNNLSNTIIYKRPTPTASPTASPASLPTESVSIVYRDETPTPTLPSLKKSSDKKNLHDVTHQALNILPTVAKPRPITPLSEEIKSDSAKQSSTFKNSSFELKRLIIEKPKDKTSSQLGEATTSITATKDSALKSHQYSRKETSERVNSKSLEENSNEEMKKRGRPKKVKKTEEETLKTMPVEEIDQVLSTISEIEDISNLLTNHIAYSRVLQTPFSSLLELNSVKKHSLNKLQLRCLLIHHIDCIGVIFRQGKDAAGKPLDEEYYYVPEMDSDKQRVVLVEELKGSSSHLRSCRKTHKQYFWKKPKV
ncbi:hypothetical protein CANINC_003754 [Pichia inconspicua]|uniref:FHA domain-containing protein n=1 Tax=Pichia inconspicua TaxID=52247 RepID=A0A4T0WXS8_9ASCO|nr:hypothetical protein CANINC_003754 [[Candida] inconspicua]